MIPENIESLAKDALKGDRQAIKDLFKAGDDRLQEGDFEIAANFLKEAAICYRIALFRQRAESEELADKVEDLKEKLRFKEKLLDAHWQGLQVKYERPDEVAFDELARTYKTKLQWTQDMATSQACIAEIWLRDGVRFSSPGGSVGRKVITTVYNILKTARDEPDKLETYWSREKLIILEPLIKAFAEALQG